MNRVARQWKSAARQKLRYRQEQKKKESEDFDCEEWVWYIIDFPYNVFGYATC